MAPDSHGLESDESGATNRSVFEFRGFVLYGSVADHHSPAIRYSSGAERVWCRPYDLLGRVLFVLLLIPSRRVTGWRCRERPCADGNPSHD